MPTFIFTVSKFSKAPLTMCLLLVLCTLSSNAQTLNVVSTTLLANARGAANDANITLVFKDNIDVAIVTASSGKSYGNQGLPVSFVSSSVTGFTDHTTIAALQIKPAHRMHQTNSHQLAIPF